MRCDGSSSDTKFDPFIFSTGEYTSQFVQLKVKFVKIFCYNWYMPINLIRIITIYLCPILELFPLLLKMIC